VSGSFFAWWITVLKSVDSDATTDTRGISLKFAFVHYFDEFDHSHCAKLQNSSSEFPQNHRSFGFLIEDIHLRLDRRDAGVRPESDAGFPAAEHEQGIAGKESRNAFSNMLAALRF
jgi:hypothetical protein